MERKICFTHPLTITRLSTFLTYVGENLPQIQPRYYPQLLLSGSVSLLLTPVTILERILYDGKIKKETVREPLFVLGHWRGGTTLVQQLLSRDKKYGFLDPLMNFAFNFYHLLGWAFEKVISEHLVDGRPMDNMQYAMDLPLEEYIVFSTFAAKSVYPLNFFPQKFREYNQNAFVDKMTPSEKARWSKKYAYLLKKITFLNDHKPLMLKSPDNTARVQVLLEQYPDAKFINIYRNPYVVIRSTMHLYEKMFETWALEKIPPEEVLEDWIIETFRDMYEAYFAQTASLPADTLYEICFEEFEKDPMPALREAYETLHLGAFDRVQKGFASHWAAQEGYKKNEFTYSPRLLAKIDDRLDFYFRHYGYEKQHP